ncbi:Lrp/AsnC ligand binding domain-containing protein [Geomicrobium sp. JCM 19038]|uniref:Lrp/AsnC ligand binding domain-containing protein n=1 Tax=Geomicrobium sp. JCM 19038 TaxID=1460635 RepID=UPI0009DEED87|nr:Lrp/AsnC ligand binding domain-containing protein [Geomicrobium sp. JCM 19038]
MCSKCALFREFCKNNEKVIECHRLTGEYSYLGEIITDTNHSLEEFIEQSMDYGKPYTMMNLSLPVPFSLFEL